MKRHLFLSFFLQSKIEDETRERVVKEKIARLKEIAEETASEANKTADRIQKFAEMLKEQADILNVRKMDTIEAQKNLAFRGSMVARVYGFMGVILLPFTAPIGYLQSAEVRSSPLNLFVGGG